jgi:hypothetical protein
VNTSPAPVPAGAAPWLSVVVAAPAFTDDYAPYLASLVRECVPAPREGQAAESVVEIIAAATGPPPESLTGCFPTVHFLSAPDGTAVAAIRAAALRRAQGSAVALTDPACRVQPGWLETLRRALAGHEVVGGAVEPAANRVRDWAAYWCEYGHYLPPLRRGPARDLTGNNVAYRREALEMAGAFDPAVPTFWKAVAHRRLRAAGVQLWAEPDLLVRHERRIAFAPFWMRRFHHARCFAAGRAADEAGSRWRSALAAPLLPALFLSRLYASVWPKGRYRWQLVLATPLLGLLYTSWAAGEWVGVLFGAGDSCERAY